MNKKTFKKQLEEVLDGLFEFETTGSWMDKKRSEAVEKIQQLASMDKGQSSSQVVCWNCQMKKCAECGRYLGRYLNVDEAAKYLALSKETIKKYVQAGKLPNYKLDRAIRFRTDDLDDLMTRHEPKLLED